MKTRGRSLRNTLLIGSLLLLAFAGCHDDEDNICRPCAEDGRAVAGTIASWDAMAGTKLRAFFWFGTHVTDPRNLILGETVIRRDGSFAMQLPEMPAELLVGQEVLASYADSACISVSSFGVKRSNYVEFSIFDSTGAYAYMAYRSSAAQDSAALPFTFGYYVYFSDAVAINGHQTMVFPGFYDGSGAWVEMPCHDHYQYDSVRFQKGWNTYALSAISATADSSKVERWFQVHAGEAAGVRWHRFYRPDLEPPGLRRADPGLVCPAPSLGVGRDAGAFLAIRPGFLRPSGSLRPWRAGTADRPRSR